MRTGSLSVIMCNYNHAHYISEALQAILDQTFRPQEVIVVDDGSRRIPLIERPGLQIKTIRLEKNRGPATARNKGAQVAQGDFLVFLDSDVELFPDTLHNLAEIFKQKPEVSVVSGTWVKEQSSKSFFPNFKALRDWSYWHQERDKNSHYCIFSTRISAMRRSLFISLGGFNESYSCLEDFELTYRIEEKCPIFFAENVRVRHEFEGFWAIAKKYFLRSCCWAQLYKRRKRFDPVGTTYKEALATASAVGLIFSTIPMFLEIAPFGYPFIIFLVTHIFFLRKFFSCVYKERGIFFTSESFFAGLIFYCFIFAGAFWGSISQKKGVLNYEKAIDPSGILGIPEGS